MRVLPARFRWAARCECGRMISALGWKLHRLRPGHDIAVVRMTGRKRGHDGAAMPVMRTTDGHVRLFHSVTWGER